VFEFLIEVDKDFSYCSIFSCEVSGFIDNHQIKAVFFHQK